MAKSKKSSGEKLRWKKLPDGGEYASYKLGTIRRYKGKYNYSTSFNTAFSAKSLAEAKRKIDWYTLKKTGK